MNLIPDISPKLFSFSAVAIGYILIDDLTANEQNALGNWLMLVAQVLCTNAFYKQVEAERNGTIPITPNNSEKEPYTSGQDTLIMMQKMVDALKKEIEEIKKQL